MTQGAADRWGIVGHDRAVQGLADAVNAGRVSHAYLLTGPEGVGRTALALALTRTLNCTAEPVARPCNTCDNCRRLLHGAHPDVTIVNREWQDTTIGRPRSSPDRQRQNISIDAIRYLRQDIVTRPILGRWKVQIIDEADRFSNDAPDAFLKTLEEPPPYAVIILIATTADSVSETIRSRCQLIELGTVARDVIQQTLTERGADAGIAAQIARAAHGRIAWAIRMAENPTALAKRRERVEEAFEHLTTPLGRIALSGTVARDYSKRKDATFELLDIVTGLWRDALLIRNDLPDAISYPEVSDRLAVWAQQFQLRDLYQGLSYTQRCVQDLDENVQARIALHAMVSQWPE
jgi:DNA polymerase-3 subunit delta'